MSIKRKFKQSIKCGTGKAYFIARDNPAVDFSKIIKKEILSRSCYDGQVDDYRAEYLFQIINVTRQQKELLKFALEQLKKKHDDWYVLGQLYEMATILALKGNEKAKKIIRKRFAKELKETNDWVGEKAILKIDGLNGLIYLVQLKGALLIENSTWSEDDYLVASFQKENPSIAVYEKLEELSKQDALVKKYLDAINAYKTSREKKKAEEAEPVWDYNFIKHKIENSRFFIANFFVKKLTTETLRQLAIDFTKELDKKKQIRYLRIFKEVAFPLGYSILLDLVKEKDKELLEEACEALALFSAKEIRDFALPKLSTKKKKSLKYLPLLILNYKKEDALLLAEMITEQDDEEVIHDLNYVYQAIYKKNRTKELILPLKILYNKLNCGVCRCGVLSLLAEDNRLSTILLKEMAYDSHEDIRALYRKLQLKKESK